MELLEQSIKEGIYAVCIDDDTNSCQIYYIPPKDLSIVDNRTIRAKHKEFKLEDYNNYWSLCREILQ